MLSCKEVSERVSESLDYELTLREKLSLWMHLAMCRLCWRFRRNLIHLDQTVRETAESLELNDSSDEPVASEARLSAEARERIRRAIQQSDS